MTWFIPLVMAASAGLADGWQLAAERTGFAETGRYEEAVSFARRLDRASRWATYTSFGTSAEGRPLPLLILAKPGAATPQGARRDGKPVVLVLNCIHAGEVDGKDASLMLARDLVVARRDPQILAKVVLLVVPIFNTDGHERFGPWNRINQNGPKEMGWRVTARNLNLNRDFVKADAVEMRALLRLWNAWRPDLVIDNHTTDGADWQYHVLHGETIWPTQHAAVARWTKDRMVDRAFVALAGDGHVVGPYVSMRDTRDPAKGVDFEDAPPRFSTGYAALRNRPGIIVETHMMKPYRQRVMATYDLMRRVLLEIAGDPASLRQAVAAADGETSAWARVYDPGRLVTLEVRRTEASEPFTLRGFRFTLAKSSASGADFPVWDRGAPVDYATRLYGKAEPVVRVAPPLAYLVPRQWPEVADLARLHGLRVEILAADAELEVESYRILDPRWEAASFEGRVMLSGFRAQSARGVRRFAAGSFVVRLDQPDGKAALHLFEPEAPDSLLRWGFFNAVLERKEYAEGYVMEAEAARMLAQDPALAKDLAAALAADRALAASPKARLDFFYRRSPYWDAQLGLYPVARLVVPAALKTR